MATQTLTKSVIRMPWLLLHLSFLVIACIIGVNVYWAAKNVASPTDSGEKLIHPVPAPPTCGGLESCVAQLQDALRSGYLFYLKAELSSITLRKDFYNQVGNALAIQAKPSDGAETDDMKFIPVNGKELLLRTGAQFAVKEFYESTLRGMGTVSKGVTAESMAEETIKAAKVDAERILQCGKTVIDDHQPRECWLKQLKKPENSSTRRLQALKALVESGTEYTDIIGALEQDQSIREEAIKSLVKSGKETELGSREGQVINEILKALQAPATNRAPRATPRVVPPTAASRRR